MDKYYAIETYQDGIELANLIRNICHTQGDNKQDVMAALETNNKVYMLYQSPYQSNVDYLEGLKSHLKLIEAHNV